MDLSHCRLQTKQQTHLGVDTYTHTNKKKSQTIGDHTDQPQSISAALGVCESTSYAISVKE